MYQHVKPADPRASVPDPVRGGFLPPDGYDVLYTAAWIALARRGDIIVSDPVGPVPGGPQPPSPAVLGTDEVDLRRGGVSLGGTTVDELATYLAGPGQPGPSAAIVAALIFG